MGRKRPEGVEVPLLPRVAPPSLGRNGKTSKHRSERGGAGRHEISGVGGEGGRWISLPPGDSGWRWVRGRNGRMTGGHGDRTSSRQALHTPPPPFFRPPKIARRVGFGFGPIVPSPPIPLILPPPSPSPSGLPVGASSPPPPPPHFSSSFERAVARTRSVSGGGEK
jgi:hypothetical protein